MVSDKTMDLCQYSRHKKFNFFDTAQTASWAACGVI
jgi:hypothetical protein